ncbi:MAG TPA: hypothetical protein VHY58_12055 [Streptosporangiaceae bacterium]|jgi:hypothetical protein|nr:hypothetical protein [Streptosporangiaceae bacterium]
MSVIAQAATIGFVIKPVRQIVSAAIGVPEPSPAKARFDMDLAAAGDDGDRTRDEAGVEVTRARPARGSAVFNKKPPLVTLSPPPQLALLERYIGKEARNEREHPAGVPAGCSQGSDSRL